MQVNKDRTINLPNYAGEITHNKAWICPVCKSGMAPHVTRCDCVTRSNTIGNNSGDFRDTPIEPK